MLRFMKPLLFGLLLGLALPWEAMAAQRDLTEAAAGKEVLLRRGDRLVVTLPSNRTTGYSWSVAVSKPDLLSQQGQALYMPPAGGKPLVGAGGSERWVFRPLHDGSVTLTFSCARPWEHGIPPARRLLYPVTITP